jgi:two-component system phosphate regulon sensor histidine kinase PhoR
MLRSSFFWRLFAGYIAVTVVALTAAWLLSRNWLEARGLDTDFGALRGAIAWAGVLSGALAFVIGMLLSRGVTRSLRDMMRVSEAMAAGEYHQRVRSKSPGEFGRLARAFDSMAAELEARVEAVTTDRNRMQAILGGMAEGVVAIDRDERVVHMNAVATRLLRAKPAPGGGARIWEATRIHEVRDILAEARDTRGPVSGELQLGGPDGQFIEMHAGPLTDGRREVVGAVLVLNDITELRRLEQIRRDFVANVSHELKTPLTAIRGMIETILDDPGMPLDVRQRFLERIEEQSQRQSALVTDLLTLSRLESERPRSERGRVDLRALVSASVRRLAPAAEGKQIRLTTELGDRSLRVVGDEEDLRQMVDNLIDNAVKYTPERGRVRITLQELPVAEDGTARCVLEVADTGIGIEPRHQERIFERFYRVDKARSRELGGTGLGLSIVKHVAKDSGGSVSLESTPGIGSSFRVELPLSG